MLAVIHSLPAFQHLVSEILAGSPLKGLGLPRAARLPVLAALHAELNLPLLFITSRTDRALGLFDELGFWAPKIERRLFPEPNPMFYERGAWGTVTRRDRLQALTALAQFHLPGADPAAQTPLLVAPIRAVMTRTLPRRDFLKASRKLSAGQEIKPEQLQREWVAVGYQHAEIVFEP
ncbi:MAG: hypothetical protein U1B80_01650, partial [Anaerolineaceae bacterium]|nr:hypothetical protein [Anaerolineaceae bacterium]